MKKNIDFSKAIPNPYVDKNAKMQITINLSTKSVEYFKKLAKKKGIPYQNLINIFLNDCVEKNKDISVI